MTLDMAPDTALQHVQVVSEARQALHEVRGALAEVYASAGADPAEPQGVARRYNLNRNLTWKLSRVLRSDEPLATLHHLPGAGGVEIAIRAFEDAGADAAAAERLRSALANLHAVIERHAGDREGLELMLESMGLFERDATSTSGRELAFRGNSSVWGLQCNARTSLTVIAPSATAPGKLDFAIVSGIAGLQRLRPGVQWRLYRAQVHDDKGSIMSDAASVEPLEPRREPDPPMMLRSLCSPNVPQLISRPTSDGVEILLPGGEVGRSAAFDCSFGYVFRRLPNTASDSNRFASTAITNTIPGELLVFDVALHRDVQFDGEPEVVLYGFPHGGSESPALQTDENRLPLREQLQRIGAHPAALRMANVPSIEATADRIFSSLGWQPAHFHAYRMVLPHPPMSSRLVMRWKLPAPVGA
jgi:hypothetical protein